MTTRHHIADDLLLSYAAGSLAEGWSLAVATHLALCAECRAPPGRGRGRRRPAARNARTLEPAPRAPGPPCASRLAQPRKRRSPAAARRPPSCPSRCATISAATSTPSAGSCIGTAGAQLRLKTGDRETQVRLLGFRPASRCPSTAIAAAS